MEIEIPQAQSEFIARQISSGRYIDESDVVRDALRVLESKADQCEDPALEAAMLAAVVSPHYPYTTEVRDRIRKNALAECNESSD